MWSTMLVVTSCMLTMQSVNSMKINGKTKRSAMAGDKLACEGGRVILQCPVTSSVYVENAFYGRPLRNDICVQSGQKEDQQTCNSPNVLAKIQSYCLAKKSCTVEVNEETLGYALTFQREPCSNTYKYLKLKYRCVADCVPPILGSGVAMIGNKFSVGSNVTVTCRNGYAASSNGQPVRHIRCMLNGSWSGGLITCQDIDECANKNDKCHFHAKCINTLGGYTCRCGDGYVGNGFACNPANVDRSWIAATKNQSYDIITDSNCGGKIYESVGVLQSPNYPSLYPNSANCQWVITVPPSQVIEVEFIDFNLEGDKTNADCSRDYLTIYNGPYKKFEEWLATDCGNQLPETIRSETNQIRLEFKSDPEASYSGFRASFRGINPKAVCENFVEPKYPGVKIIEGNTNATAVAGDVLLLGCKVGYHSVASSKLNRVCQNDNTWDNISNPCTPARCNKPPHSSNSSLKLNGTSRDYHYMGDSLMYSCKTGLFLVATAGVKSVIFCNVNGRWSNEGDTDFPYCKPITCEITSDLTSPQHASWDIYDRDGNRLLLKTGASVAYHSFIQYSCVKGYTTIDESVRTCFSGNGNQWSGKPILCEEDNGIHGLTNHQIALITAIISGVIILMVGAALLYTCVKESKEKREKKRNPLGYQRQISKQSYRNNRRSLWLSSNDGSSSFSFRKSNKKNPKKRKSVDLEIRSSTNKNETNSSKKYSRNRPYLLPSVIKPTAPAWSQLPHRIDIVPYSTIDQDEARRKSLFENPQTQTSQFMHSPTSHSYPDQFNMNR